MTRAEALGLYRPIRASMRRILSAAFRVCNQSDLMRAAKHLGLWIDGKIFQPEGEQAAEMLSDIALFEPNQRGRRAFDTFLGGKALQLDDADVDSARRMGSHVHGLSGRQYVVKEGIVVVADEDARPLFGAGFTRA